MILRRHIYNCDILLANINISPCGGLPLFVFNSPAQYLMVQVTGHVTMSHVTFDLLTGTDCDGFVGDLGGCRQVALQSGISSL